MKQTIQSKIDAIKTISAKMKLNDSNVSASRTATDNLSKSIRNKREAEIFQNELNAIRQAKS